MMSSLFTAAYTSLLLYLIIVAICKAESSKEAKNSEINGVSSEIKATTIEAATSTAYPVGALYKLYYFDFRGRGEPIRLLFHYAAEPFEDFRIDRSDWLPTYKNNTLYGHVPMLEIKSDGRVMAESYAIARFIAKKFGEPVKLKPANGKRRNYEK